MGRPWTGHCWRCGEKTLVSTMSFFNEDMICMDCEAKERQHPAYAAARAAEEAETARGNLNFAGIGKPEDL